jgi:serine/threonine protein kinase
MRDVLCALAYVHKNGGIHRDVKARAGAGAGGGAGPCCVAARARTRLP